MQVSVQGKTVFTGSNSDFEAVKVQMAKELGIDVETFKVSYSKAEITELIRHQITESAGDTASLLGTTADGVQLLLFAFAQMTVALNQAQSLADVRQAAAPFNDLSVSFLAKVESGEVKLPFIAKGLDNVIADIEKRATAVTNVLTEEGNQ